MKLPKREVAYEEPSWLSSADPVTEDSKPTEEVVDVPDNDLLPEEMPFDKKDDARFRIKLYQQEPGGLWSWYVYSKPISSSWARADANNLVTQLDSGQSRDRNACIEAAIRVVKTEKHKRETEKMMYF